MSFCLKKALFLKTKHQMPKIMSRYLLSSINNPQNWKTLFKENKKLRKALGAKEGVIMRQFVMEAATTAALGGTIGIGLGYLASSVATSVIQSLLEAPLQVTPSAGSIALAFGVSAGIGVLFGYLPAKKASRLNPIDALRYD